MENQTRDWSWLYGQIIELNSVIRHNTHPKHITLHYNRNQLKFIWAYGNTKELSLPLHYAWRIVNIIQSLIFFATLLAALPESKANFLELGSDIVWICGGFYIILKVNFISFYANDIDVIVDDLSECHTMPRYPTAEADVRQTQRWYFLLQSFIIVFWHIGCGSFAILALTQPVFTKQALPFHAWLPMDLHNPEKHPIAHALVYAWQVMSLSYNLCICVYVDLQSTFCYPEVAVNLKILCIELNAFARECQHDEQRFRREFRRLAAFHQRMMRNVTSINDVYYWPMIGQMVFVFVMISLTAFIALANKGDPNTYKFIVFMILSLAYLTFICALGDMVTQQSQEVAMAAYDIYEHAPNSKEVQLDIGFMMYRAQEPLQIGAPPFPPFNLISNMAVLKQCYAILTVLLETLD